MCIRDSPLGAVEEMFDAKNLKFEPDKILFSEPMQRELALFQINKSLPEGKKLSASDLTPFNDMNAETLGGFLNNMTNIRPNTSESGLFDISPLFEDITEGDEGGTGDDKISSNTLVMPNTNNDIAMIDGNASAASVTVSTDYSSNDGVTIDNFHNIIQYDSPAVFGGVTV